MGFDPIIDVRPIDIRRQTRGGGGNPRAVLVEAGCRRAWSSPLLSDLEITNQSSSSLRCSVSTAIQTAKLRLCDYDVTNQIRLSLIRRDYVTNQTVPPPDRVVWFIALECSVRVLGARARCDVDPLPVDVITSPDDLGLTLLTATSTL